MTDHMPIPLSNALYDLKDALLKSNLLREIAFQFFNDVDGQAWAWDTKTFDPDICHTYIDEESGQELSVSYISSSDRVYLTDAENTWRIAFTDLVWAQSMGDDTDDRTWFGKSEVTAMDGSPDGLATLLTLKKLASAPPSATGNMGSLLGKA